MEYQIHPELAGLHRDLKPAEREQLEENCIQDGKILDPIVVWNEYILDGRNRYRIAQKHGLRYDVLSVSLDSFEEAKAWVITHQLGKRNLDQMEASRLRAEHARIVGDEEEVAEAHGVSPRTIRRDKEQMAAQEMMDKDVLEKCLSGEIINSKQDWRHYKKLTDEQRRQVDQKLREDPGLTLRAAMPLEEAGLSVDDFEILQNSLLHGQQKQLISTGHIHATHKDVQALGRLSDDKQIIVSELLRDPEIDGLDDALLTLRNGLPKPADDEAKVEQIGKKIEVAYSQASSLLERMRQVKSDKSGFNKAKEALNEAIDAWRAWR